LGFYACAVPTFEQLTLAKFIDRGYFDRHLSRMRNIYRKRRDEAMELFLRSGYPLEISEENAGLHFLVKLKTDLSDEAVKAKAAAQGVKLSFLSDFALAGGENMQHCIVVNYSEL
jgi:GntR family transcriptional regulator/MocR family aminotransferase